MVSGITGVQGKYSSYVGGGKVLDGEITEIFWVATKIFVFLPIWRCNASAVG